jgi:hypothetical protein
MKIPKFFVIQENKKSQTMRNFISIKGREGDMRGFVQTAKSR